MTIYDPSSQNKVILYHLSKVYEYDRSYIIISMANHVMHTYDTTTEVQDKLCDFIIKVANEAIQKTGSFFLAVSGF